MEAGGGGRGELGRTWITGALARLCAPLRVVLLLRGLERGIKGVLT